MTIELLDPNDTGDIPPIDGLGDEPTRNLRAERDAILAATSRLRHCEPPTVSLVTGHGYDPEADSGPVVDMVDTVTFRITGDLAGPQKPVPVPTPPKPKYDDPAETGVNIFGGLGEHLPEVVFLEPHNYVGRHRHPEDLDAAAPGRHPAHERRLSPWWALAGVVLAGLAIWAGLILAGAAVIW